MIQKYDKSNNYCFKNALSAIIIWFFAIYKVRGYEYNENAINRRKGCRTAAANRGTIPGRVIIKVWNKYAYIKLAFLERKLCIFMEIKCRFLFKKCILKPEM